MEINKEILCKILNIKESQSKSEILQWYIVDNIAKVGTNSSSEMSRLVIKYEKKGKLFQKFFILKVPSIHPVYQTCNEYQIYDKEFLIYTTILEEMYKLDGEHIGPRFYYCDNKHSMILKDLAASGYKMKDRLERLDFDHCRLVFMNLAKFHALSVKLDQMSKIPKILKRLVGVEKMKNDFESIKMLSTVFEWFVEGLDCPEYNNRLCRWGDKIFGKLIDEKMLGNGRIRVLCHGDCWTSNILFKSDKYGSVEKIKFIDFQFSMWGPSTYDILFFILTSMQIEVLEKHFDLLLETYLNTLNRILDFFGCDTYTIEDLKLDMDIPYTVLWILMIPLVQYYSCRENPWNSKECMKDGKWDLNYGKIHYENPSYRKLVKKLFLFFAEKGIFNSIDNI